MKNKDQKILQNWIDTLQGISVRGMDSKSRLEARLLKKAWLEESKKIENKIPDHDPAFYQNIKEALKKKKDKTASKNLWTSFFENKFKAFLVVILGTGVVYASKKTYDGLVSVAEELNHVVLAKDTTKTKAENEIEENGFWDEHFDKHGGFTGFWSRYIPKINERNIPIVEVDNFCSHNATLNFNACLELANQYNSNARFNLGLMYELGLNVEQNSEQAYEWYKKSSALGNEDARSNMEYLIKKGLVY